MRFCKGWILPHQKSTETESPECQVVSRGIHARGRKVKAIDKRHLQGQHKNANSHCGRQDKDRPILCTNSKGNSKYIIINKEKMMFQYLSLNENLPLSSKHLSFKTTQSL